MARITPATTVRAAVATVLGTGLLTGGAAGTVFPDYPYDHTRAEVPGSLYVSPAGNDGNDGLSKTSPKQTISAAHSALGTSSSKVIYLMSGTHTMSAAINTSISGTSSNPIQITGCPNHTPVLDVNGVYRAFNLDGVSWWRISHLKVVNWGGGGGDDGGFVIGEDALSSHISFFCVQGTTPHHGDNNAFAHVYGQRASEISFDRIDLKFTGDVIAQHANNAGIYVVRLTAAGPITMDHMEIRDFSMNVYQKHGEPDPPAITCSISNSFFAGAKRGTIGFNPAGWAFTHCIFGYGRTDGVWNNTLGLLALAEADGGQSGRRNSFDHCTLYGGLWLRGDQNQNGAADPDRILLTNSVIAKLILEDQSDVLAASDYNVFAAGSVVNGGTLPGWQGANSSDAHSVQGAIVYAGGDPSTIAFYALVSGSAGKGAANDGTDAGADLLRVGVRAA